MRLTCVMHWYSWQPIAIRIQYDEHKVKTMKWEYLYNTRVSLYEYDCLEARLYLIA